MACSLRASLKFSKSLTERFKLLLAYFFFPFAFGSGPSACGSKPI